MIDVEELRRALDRYAAIAPDSVGLVAAAVAIHRRRRRRRVTAAIAAVAVLVAVVPLLVDRLGRSGRVTPAATPSTSASPAVAYRRPLELTVDLLPGQAAAKLEYGVWTNAQFIMVRPAGAVAAFGEVLVYDLGALDTGPFLAGDKVQVHGHVAYHVATFSGGTFGGAVGWSDPSGAWVVVTGADSLDGLLGLADIVRVGVPGQVVAPYHLSYVPPGLPVTSALIRKNDPSLTQSVLTLGGIGPTSLRDFDGGARNADLVIEAVNRTEGVDSYQKGVPPSLTIAGHDAWWYNPRAPGPLLLRQNAAALMVNAGNCQLRLYVDDVNKHPLDELQRIVEGASFRDCTNGTTWVAPLD